MGINDAAEMLESAKEECGRLERELASEKAGRQRDFQWMHAKVGEVLGERDEALAIIADVRKVNTWNDLNRILTQSPLDALDAHDRELVLATAERSAALSEYALLLHEIGTPGEGPFTNGQRYADEARVQIAAKIRAEFKIVVTK